ncbi:MAG: phospholipase D family protein [Candidatus Dormiibacterota bacterium]
MEGWVRDHHRRRLDRLGWAEAISPVGTPLWAAEEPAPRGGNSLRVHVDGAAALPAMAAAMRRAQSSVHIAAWHSSPDFRLARDDGAPPLRDLLAAIAERVPVRLLMWAGPPAPVFKPTRGMARASRQEFVRDSRVQCALDARERSLHCHHEKLVIVDGRVAFVGGIDLTALAGDRYDSPAHRPHAPIGWHDAAVELAGPAVGDVARHFAARWREATGEPLPEPELPEPAGPHTVQVVRTVPERTYRFARRGDFTLVGSYLRALRSARRLIYLENQFLWSTEVVDILVEKLRHPPADAFRILLVLPARPNNGADTTRGQLGRLLEADGDAHRLLATTLTAHDEEANGPLYVHAKIGIVDDEWLTIGSANLNEHSLFNDTEMNVVTCDATLVRETRLQLWAEHLQAPFGEFDGDPAQAIDQVWRPLAEEQLRRSQAGEPRTHRLSLLPGVSRRTERLFGPMRGLLVDG